VAEKLGFDFQNLKNLFFKIYFHFIGYWVMHGPSMRDVWSKHVEELLKEVIASSTYIYIWGHNPYQGISFHLLKE
jgi:hypothetical protein